MVVTDYNEQFLDKRGTDHLIEELKAYIDSISTGSVDLSDYVTKSELQAKLDALHINIDLSSYATKEELTQAINSIDLSAYALKTEIPSLDGYATTEYVDNAIANVPTGGTTDLSNYYTKDETYSKTEVDTLVANSGGSSSGGSSGSSSGITYAYNTEIATGETWVDGKPIYLKVFHIDKLASQSKVIDYKEYYSQPKFAETIVSVIPTWKNSDNISTGFIDDVVSSVSTDSKTVGNNVNNYILSKMMWCTVYNGSEFSIMIGRGNSRYTASCDVFVKYTKL